MNPMIHEAVLAAKREEVLSGVEHRRQFTEASAQRKATNAVNGDVDRHLRLRVWLLHQLTWPRWPRVAVDEA